jgi:hypothetical protein
MQHRDRRSGPANWTPTPVIMLVVNAALALITGLLLNFAIPQNCTETVGTHLGGKSAVPVLEYRTCSPAFGPADSAIIALLVFVIAVALELSLDARKILAIRREQSVIWRADDEAARHLYNILVHARQVASAAYGKYDRYIRYFMGEFVQLEDKIRQAAEQQDLVVPSDEFQSPEDIEGAFKLDSLERVFRYTWPISGPGSVFTSTGWRYFFDLTVRMLANKTLTGVCALLILDDASLLRSPNVQRLLTLYRVTSGANARVVVRDDFRAIAARNGVRQDWLDFGIYNNSLLYVTERDNGRFTKNSFRIGLYLTLFESVWDSAGVIISSSEDLAPDPSLTLSRLLELDTDPISPAP